MGRSNTDFGQSPLPIEVSPPETESRKTSFEVSLLSLSGIDGLGRKGLKALVKRFGGDLGAVWGASSDQLRTVLANSNVPSSGVIASLIKQDTKALIEKGHRKLEELTSKRVYVVAPHNMPAKLRDIPDKPSWLFVQGDLDLLHDTPTVAVVGTRKPSEQGLRAARVVARLLAAYPIALVSGLAEGVDEEAHRTSLDEGVRNVAFLGHGINYNLSEKSRLLRRKILEQGGAVVSEYLPDEHYRKAYFVERNRLQAALADLVVPVEANPKGGTAHTVRFAGECERPLLGIAWKYANGILEELEREGHSSIPIFTADGQKKLDGIFRELAEEYGRETDTLYLVRRKYLQERRLRRIRRTDIEKLIELLEDVAADAD
jgi:DNA processing protein